MAAPGEVLVLVTDAAHGPKLAAAVERVTQKEIVWLAHPTAVEIRGDWNLEEEILLMLARYGFNGNWMNEDQPARLPADIWLLPPGDRRKKLLVADMDSTIIGQECIDELADAAGVRAEVSAITEQAMRGEIDFLGALSERVAMLKGLDAAVIGRILDERITLNPGARELVRTMRASGAHTALVSGGFSQFVERIAERAGFDTWQANTLEIEDGRLTGRLVAPILDQEAKSSDLKRLATLHRIDLTETLAVGDGANDVEMIRAAGLGVAYRGKPVLEEAAGASIRHGDLRALLYLQGYGRDSSIG